MFSACVLSIDGLCRRIAAKWNSECGKTFSSIKKFDQQFEEFFSVLASSWQKLDRCQVAENSLFRFFAHFAPFGNFFENFSVTFIFGFFQEMQFWHFLVNLVPISGSLFGDPFELWSMQMIVFPDVTLPWLTFALTHGYALSLSLSLSHKHLHSPSLTHFHQFWKSNLSVSRTYSCWHEQNDFALKGFMSELHSYVSY